MLAYAHQRQMRLLPALSPLQNAHKWNKSMHTDHLLVGLCREATRRLVTIIMAIGGHNYHVCLLIDVT